MKFKLGASLILLFIITLLSCANANARADEEIPVKGMATMVNLGANQCLPCRMMAPILEELKDEYKGKTAIVFLDVWKDPSQARRFKIRVIPTQIFFDKKGKEIYRHQGFLEKKKIIQILKKLGA